MARRTQLTSLRQINEINLTPLMDLTFILLITFIITFPLIEQGIPVDLPKGKARELSAERTSTITLDREGAVYLDDVRTDLAALGKRLSDLEDAAPGLTVMVRADERLDYGRIVKVLKVLHDANVHKMALVTQGE